MWGGGTWVGGSKSWMGKGEVGWEGVVLFSLPLRVPAVVVVRIPGWYSLGRKCGLWCKKKSYWDLRSYTINIVTEKWRNVLCTYSAVRILWKYHLFFSNTNRDVWVRVWARWFTVYRKYRYFSRSSITEIKWKICRLKGEVLTACIFSMTAVFFLPILNRMYTTFIFLNKILPC